MITAPDFRLLLKLLGVVVLFAWFLAPFWAIPTGENSFASHPDPAMGAVAASAMQAASIHNDNPIGRLLLPAPRVVRVWKDPGRCPATDPGGQEPFADYRAGVRFHTYFGIPVKTLRVTCGGWAW